MGRAGILSGCVTLELGSLRGATSTHTDLPTIGSQSPENTNFDPKHLPKAHVLPKARGSPV